MPINEQSPALRFAFATRTTLLATGTTIGASTRHDFSAITMWGPLGRSYARASGGRVFVRITGYIPSAAVDIDVIRIGIKIGAVAFDDLDVTIALVNTGNHINFERWRDVTDYFATNDPGTASFSVQVGVAVATGAASNVQNLTAEVIATCGFDTALTTKLYQTLMLPIQSHHATPANDFTTYQEVGALGTAPVANQIAQLTGVGGELDGIDGLSIKARYLVITAMSNTNSVAYAVDLRIRFDGGAHTVLPFGSGSVATNNRMTWIVDISSLSTTAAHTWQVVTGMSTSIEGIGAIEVVTFEHDSTSLKSAVCVLVPLESLNGSETSYPIRNITAADADRLTARFEVLEPSPVMLRSGVMLADGMFTGGADTILAATGQTERTYDRTTTGGRTGFAPIVHRCDHSGSTWTVVRGPNKLSLDVRTGSLQANQNPTSGYALINYRCGRHSGGISKHARSMPAAIVIPYTESVLATSVPDEPVIVPASYVLFGAMVEHMAYASGRMAHVGAQRLLTEDNGKGWLRTLHLAASTIAELSDNPTYHPATSWWRRRTGLPVGIDLEAERKWLAGSSDAIGHVAILHVAYHSMTFTVTGTVTLNGIGEGFATVTVYAFDADNLVERVTTAFTDGTGAFSATVPDDVRTYFVTYSTGRSLNGTPGASVFNVAINSAPGVAYDLKITARPSYITTSSSASFTFTATAGTVEASIDGAAFAPVTSPLALNALANGPHSVVFRSFDYPTETHTEEWIVDTTGGTGPGAVGYGVYNRAKMEILSGAINLKTDALKVMLVNATYVPNLDDDVITGAALTAEVTGTGYVGGHGGSGRKALAGRLEVESDANDAGYLTATPLVWSALNVGVVGGAIIVKEIAPNDASSRLVAYVDLSNTLTSGSDFTLTWNPLGVIKLA